MNETEKKINNSSKRIPNGLFDYVSFEHIHFNPIKLLFYNHQQLPYTAHLFLGIYRDRQKRKKRGKVWLLEIKLGTMVTLPRS